MRQRRALWIGLLTVVPLLAACSGGDLGPPPKPVEITRDATGYYCQMIIADHPGPKAQIHLVGNEKPIFFPSVVDAVAFLMMPGESKAVRAVYVNDMARAKNWTSPEPGTWTDAKTAFFVINSTRQGGMGQKEAVPFSIRNAAETFVTQNGGRVARLSEIPASYVMPGVEGAVLSRTSPGQSSKQGHEEGLP